jgi:hypothetical protein
LFLDLWVSTGTAGKARTVLRRAAARARLPVQAFELIGFDEAKQQWGFSGVVPLPAIAPDGGWEALRVLHRIARTVSVSGPTELDHGRWALEGYAVEADLAEPGLAFLAFSARSD